MSSSVVMAASVQPHLKTIGQPKRNHMDSYSKMNMFFKTKVSIQICRKILLGAKETIWTEKGKDC